MTTTAHEDQFTVAPEPVHQPYSTADILRRNVADLEIALRKQTERAEAAEAELAKLRKQKPVAWINLNKWTPSNGPRCVTHEEYEKERELLTKLTAVYAHPVPAAPAVAVPAVPEEWRNIVTKMLGWWDAPVMTMSQGKFIAEKARALLQSAEVTK